MSAREYTQLCGAMSCKNLPSVLLVNMSIGFHAAFLSVKVFAYRHYNCCLLYTSDAADEL